MVLRGRGERHRALFTQDLNRTRDQQAGMPISVGDDANGYDDVLGRLQHDI